MRSKVKIDKPLHDTVLLVISHTIHYLDDAGNPCGWIPTVRELDFLAGYFKKIIHLAVLANHKKAPKGVCVYTATNIDFEPIPFYGGKNLKEKISVVTTMPQIIAKTRKLLRDVDVFQFRAPTSMGVYLIPYLTHFSKKKGWYKYAGNWKQENMPISYRIQKFLLEKTQSRPVTINGTWKNQKDNIFSFENPSLNLEDIEKGIQVSKENIHEGLKACFVGRLVNYKGVDRIINAIDVLVNKGVTEIIFVGDGPEKENYLKKVEKHSINIHFYGYLDREEVFDIYKKSHLIFLPSDSEGFPKVIAEAACFGCVPIVSDVSAIPQYINDSNGYLWDQKKDTFTNYCKKIDLNPQAILYRSKNIKNIAKQFTFEAYLEKLRDKIL